jgi:hypothetical protein
VASNLWLFGVMLAKLLAPGNPICGIFVVCFQELVVYSFLDLIFSFLIFDTISGGAHILPALHTLLQDVSRFVYVLCACMYHGSIQGKAI